MMQFCQILQKKKEELQLSQKELCSLLYEVPHRTLQSWLQGEKEPPAYVQELIIFRLELK
jgi:DNA-binding transcriptional regulator YiaG